MHRKWSIPILIWVAIWILMSWVSEYGSHFIFYLQKNVFIVSLMAVVVYSNILWIYPKYFKKRKIGHFTFLGILIIYVTYYLFQMGIGPWLELCFEGSIHYSDNRNPLHPPTSFWQVLHGSAIFSFSFLVSTLIRIGQQVSGLSKERSKLLEDLQEWRIQKAKAPNPIIIKSGKQTHIIPPSEIYYIKGLREYVQWYTQKGTIVHLQSLQKLKDDLAEYGFIQIHKSYIINTAHLDLIESNRARVKGEWIPIGRVYKDSIKSIST